MPTSLSAVDICNVALSKIGAAKINSLIDLGNKSAVVCNTNFQLAYLEVSRAAQWNCLLTPAVLVQIPQTPIPTFAATPVTAWAPFTSYLANVYLSYGGYIYITAYAYTSTNNFTIDLTTGALIQTNTPATSPTFPDCGTQYPSGWNFQYALPDDYQLLAALNDNWGWWGWDGCGASSAEYEIMGLSLYCNESQAVIQYVKNQPDTAQWDAMFTNAVTLKLASTIATLLRQDDGQMERIMDAGYKSALREARTKNAGERLPRRFNPIESSNFNRARYGGING